MAEIGLKDDSPPSHTICYLCHSAAEKYIKALLLKLNWKLIKSHDLLYLGNQLREYGLNVDLIWQDLGELNV
jgi:HEPN domain-containing protein